MAVNCGASAANNRPGDFPSAFADARVNNKQSVQADSTLKACIRLHPLSVLHCPRYACLTQRTTSGIVALLPDISMPTR